MHISWDTLRLIVLATWQVSKDCTSLEVVQEVFQAGFKVVFTVVFVEVLSSASVRTRYSFCREAILFLSPRCCVVQSTRNINARLARSQDDQDLNTARPAY